MFFMSDDLPQISPLVVGLRCKYPRCGEGLLFDGFLTVRTRCPRCDLDLSAADSGDGPAVFVIFIVGPIATGLALLTEAMFAPPNWLHLVDLAATHPRWCGGATPALQGDADRLAIQV